MKYNLCLVTVVVLTVLSCASSEMPPTPSETPPPASNERDIQAPLTLRVEGPSQIEAGQQIVLHWIVDIQAPLQIPVSIHVDTPKGTVLLKGEPNEALPAGEAGVVRRELLVRVDSLPAGDLRVIADAQGAGFGVHAVAEYRFGRPEPRLSDPLRGAPLKFGGQSLGKPILIPSK